MEGSGELIDSRGRFVRLMRTSDGSPTETYYMGRDCEGIIKVDEGGREFIEVEGDKRYWGGLIDPLPDDPRIQALDEFVVFMLKPDGIKLGLGKAIVHLIEQSGGTIVIEKDFFFDEVTIRKMYPYFFAEEWKQQLFDYLVSGSSRCFLIKGEHVQRKMFTLRNSIRQLFGCNSNPQVVSLVHCAQRQSDSIKQAILFFSLDEIVTAVGLKQK
jgi:nucleoside diphosphate kinase